MEEDTNKEIKKLFAAAQKIEMPEIPKRHIKMSILQSVPKTSMLSPFTKYMRLAAVPVMIALLFVGGGVSYAAESTIPGDTLYTVKTKVNEKVAGFFAFSETSKTDWEGKLALRRLGEVERIADRRGMSVEEVLETHFARQAERFADRLEMIKESGNDTDVERLESKFAKAITKHERILDRIENGSLAPTTTRRAFDRLAFVDIDRSRNIEVAAAPVAVVSVARMNREMAAPHALIQEKHFDISIDLEKIYSATDIIKTTVRVKNITGSEQHFMFNNGCKEIGVQINNKNTSDTQEVMFCTEALVKESIESYGSYEQKLQIDLRGYSLIEGQNKLNIRVGDLPIQLFNLFIQN